MSSERAFSSAGITISKRRNRLKADVVEALQGLKCMICHDVLFREHPTASSELSDEDEADTVVMTPPAGSTGGAATCDERARPWDQLLADDDDVFDAGIRADNDSDVYVQGLE